MSLKTAPYLHRPSLAFKSVPSPRLFSTSRLSLSLSRAFVSMASAAPNTVEHVVLFQVRESTDQPRIDAMLSGLRSLTRLGIATHLTAGPVRAARSSAAAPFTHLLHSRYRSPSDLAAYSAHPDHVSVVRDHVLPICDDVMALDWLARLDNPAFPGSALRLTLAKLKDGAAAADVVAAVAGAEGAVPGLMQLSCGENFSPARAKGYGVGSIAVFPSAEELEKLEMVGGVLEQEKEKVRPLLESVIVLDYVVPVTAPASL